MNIYAKKDLTNEQLMILESEMSRNEKSKTPMWLLWVFTGGIGGHRYYLGDIGYAVAMTFCNWMTLGIWGLIDAFFINKRLEKKNHDMELDILNKIK